MSLLLALACPPSDYNPGTIVGNPGSAKVNMGTPIDLTFGNAQATAGTLTFVDCEGTSFTQELDAVDMLGTVPVAPVLVGEWCGLGLELHDVTLAGNGPSSTTFILDVDFVAIWLEAWDWSLSGDDNIVIELGEPGWLSAEDLGLPENGTVELDSSDPLTEDIVDSLETEAAAFDDVDGDGIVDKEERENPQTASGFPPEPDGGCGCQEYETVSVAFIVLLPWLRRRRRR